MEDTDYLIIGQGIAGTLLAHLLQQRGKKIIVIDRCDEYSSSLVAAGIFNPVTGRRFVTTWKMAYQWMLKLKSIVFCTFLKTFNIFKVINQN